jgi:predicted alpha/beta-fold hydrolase
MRRQIRPKILAHPDRFAPLSWSIGSLRNLDELYIAPDAGYPSPEAYYEGASAQSRLGSIATPCFVLTANDDPFVPPRLFESLPPAPVPLQIMVTANGGHVGYLSSRSRRIHFCHSRLARAPDRGQPTRLISVTGDHRSASCIDGSACGAGH